MGNLELRHGILADSDCLKEYINRQKVEELEKIKAEIEEIDNIVHEHGATYINKYGIVKVFNSHISELKGEQE